MVTVVGVREQSCGAKQSGKPIMQATIKVWLYFLLTAETSFLPLSAVESALGTPNIS